MGLCDHSDFKVYGLGLNEASVQLMASKVIGIKNDFVKYFGISFETNSPSYYPLECCLANQLAYLIGEDILFESTINSNDNFKNKFIESTSIKTFLCVQSALDSILYAEEDIIKLNNKMIESTKDRCDNIIRKIEELKNERNAKNERLAKTENEINSEFETLEGLKEQIVKIDVKKTKLEQDLEQVVNKLWEEYELTPNSAGEYRKPNNVQDTQKQVNYLRNENIEQRVDHLSHVIRGKVVLPLH